MKLSRNIAKKKQQRRSKDAFSAVLGRREPKSSHTTAREPRDWRVRAGRRAAMSEPFEFPEFFDYPPYFTCVSRRCRPSALGPSDFV